MLKRYMLWLYMSAHRLNALNTLEWVEPRPGCRMLDLGCSDGQWTMQIAERALADEVHGIEVLPEAVKSASERGIRVNAQRLEAQWDYPDGYFDLVHSSFVIEHVASIDQFVSESFRVLKPGGLMLASTENGSSWHNVFAAAMGWQTFSSACCSIKAHGLGNPLALHRGETGEVAESQTHKVIFNYRGYVEIFQAHGFREVEVRGAGYHPLPPILGRFDPRHSHFILARAQKPLP